MEETSVGAAFASEAYVLEDLEAVLLIEGMAERDCNEKKYVSFSVLMQNAKNFTPSTQPR